MHRTMRGAARTAQRRWCVVGLPSREQMKRLSIKDLRLLAAKNRIALDDCVEKAQMIDKILGDTKEPEVKYKAPTKGTLASMFTARELVLGGTICAILVYLFGKSLFDRIESSEIRGLRRKMAEGDKEAALELAKALYKGTGAKQNPAEAFEILKAAAETGDSWALCEVGGMYCRGDGVTQNYKTGYSYFLAAAGKGNANAMHNLAKLCEAGVGTIRDPERAEYWREEAVKAIDVDEIDIHKMMDEEVTRGRR